MHSGSGSRIKKLTKAKTHRQKAKRFLKWRKRNGAANSYELGMILKGSD